MTEPALEIRHLNKTIGRLPILSDISLTIEPGEFLVLVGPSGCGKSTLLACIAGLTEISAGEILIGGRDMTFVKPADRDIAMVFQSYALFPTMTVAENITFGMRVRKVDPAERQRLLAEVARQLNIEELLARKPAALSGGQRQRVAMARALVRQPHLFLFDEPLSNLDAKLRVSMRTEIKRLHQALGASIVYVTHDQIEAMTLATRIVVLKAGRIQQIGTPAEIYDKPASTFVADFIGSPPMNLVPATLTAAADGLHVAFALPDGRIATLIDRRPAPALAASQDRPVIFGVRPESVELAGPDWPDPACTAEIEVEVVEATGSDTFAVINLGQREFIARMPARTPVRAGAVARFGFDLTHACYFDPASQARIALEA